MRTSRILAFMFFAVSLGIAYYLFQSLRFEISAREEIRRIESDVIDKLKMIREAQIAYRSTHDTYASSWDTLIDFVSKGKMYILTRRERVIPLDYGADSILVDIDTLGAVSVRDSLFKASVYPDFNPEDLPYIPHTTDAKFSVFTKKIQRSGVIVDVIEVRDTSPANPSRKADHKVRSKRPLQFGSRTNVSLSGNWE